MKKRDHLRMTLFNLKKKEENLLRKIEGLEKDLTIKQNIIFKLEVDVSKRKFLLIKSRPKLAIRNVANQNIPPESPLLKFRQNHEHCKQ